jgi:hypothetical protein
VQLSQQCLEGVLQYSTESYLVALGLLPLAQYDYESSIDPEEARKGLTPEQSGGKIPYEEHILWYQY